MIDNIYKEKYVDHELLNDIKNFYNKWYVAKNMSVIVVGSINKKNIEKNIEKYFSPLRNHEVPEISKSFKISDDQRILSNFQEMDINETYFNISFSTSFIFTLKTSNPQSANWEI